MAKFIDLTEQRFGTLVAKSSFFIGVGVNKKTMWKCVCDCGNTTNVHAKSLRNGKTQSCGKAGCRKKPILFDLTGQRFGFLTAQFFKDGEWVCNCDCGSTKPIPSAALRSGNTKSCGCKTNSLISEKNTLPDNGAVINRIYYTYQFSAKRREFSFELSFADFNIFINNNCHYCGSAPMLATITLNSKCAPKEIYYNGIDRKDSNIGYILSNCVSCCRICNRAKGDMPYEDFLAWIHKMISFRNPCNQN